MQKKPTVLLVDDNPDNLSELESLLAFLEAETTRALSMEQAIQLAQEQIFDTALLSACMPGVDACALLCQLGQLPFRLPVILLFPHYPDENAVREAYAAGAFDVLFRPLIPFVVVNRVNICLMLNGYPAAEQLTRNRLQSANGQQKSAEELFAWLSHSMEQIGQAMASTLDMVEVPNLVLEQLPDVVPYERGSILLRDGESLRMVATRGFPPDWPISDAHIPIRKDDIFQQIVHTREPLLIDDVTTTSAWSQAEGLPLNRSWLGVPLVAKDHVIGMVSLTRRDAAAFRPEEVAFIRASASQAAVALVNASLLNDLKRFNEQLELLVHERTEELKIAYAKLEKIDQTKTSFISVIAHELRTPLTLIQGYASLLGSIVKENKDASDLIQGIIIGERRLLDVVNNMVDVSKIDNQALLVRKTPTSLYLILKIIYNEYKTALQDRQISLTITDLENLPDIHADSDLIGKMFRQLISNAIKYTPDGGSILVQGRSLSETHDEASEKSAIEVEIIDTGIGIDPAYQDVIFDKFYQMGPVELHSSGKTKYKGGGPGLGLAIARGIARAHGGRIWVESPGHNEETFPGSNFHVVLPVEN
jgi:signal transduction histidine kinase/CheY-like chemotaxis protein